MVELTAKNVTWHDMDAVFWWPMTCTLSHGSISSPQEGIFLLDQLDGDWSRLWFLVSQVRLGHCDYFIVQYVQRHVLNNSVLSQALSSCTLCCCDNIERYVPLECWPLVVRPLISHLSAANWICISYEVVWFGLVSLVTPVVSVKK